MLNAYHGQRPVTGLFAVGLVLALTLAGCTRPADRPLEGARPGRAVAAAASSPEPGRTLVVAVDTPIPSPTATVPPAASPASSPSPAGRGPVVSTIQPAANSTVGAGVVTISARVSSLSDISEVTLSVDGQSMRPTAVGDSRTPTYSVTMNLPAGEHQARIFVRDDQGRTGGFTWRFAVGDGPARPSPAPKR